MFSVYLECGATERDELLAELNERGTLGVLELSTGLRAWFDDGAGITDLVDRYDGAVVDEPASDEDWARRNEESFPAFAIGERFWLTPPWNSDPVPAGRLRLEINPGMACGTGWHECTQLCLEALEREVRPGDRVLDVGTGSGILSVAARLLGAITVISCDIDPDACASARERLASNTVFIGAADAVAADSFDIVVANISAEVVRDLLPEFERTGQRVLILSGFPQSPLAAAEIHTKGLWECAVVHIG